MSPVLNQPSTKASRVASSRFQYPAKTLGPFSRTSPVSDSRTETPGRGSRRCPDAARPHRDWRFHDGFGHAVAFEDGVAEQSAEFFEDLRGQRRGAGDEQAHAAADLMRGVLWSFEKTDVNGRDAEEKRRAEIQELVDGGLMFESFEQAHAAAGDEPAMQAVAEGVDVEERQGQAGSGPGR